MLRVTLTVRFFMVAAACQEVSPLSESMGAGRPPEGPYQGSEGSGYEGHQQIS